MNYIIKSTDNNVYLAHHGILGQKWGVRRYQNEDGSLKAAGKKHREDVRNLSNAEIERRIARNELENRAKYYLVGDNHASENANAFRKTVDTSKEAISVIGKDKINDKNMNVINSSAKAIKDASSMVENVANNRRSKKNDSIDLSNYSDKELNDFIRRKQLEDMYVSSLNPQKQKSGAERVSEIMSTVGTVLAVASSGIALYKAIKG